MLIVFFWGFLFSVGLSSIKWNLCLCYINYLIEFSEQ